MTSQDLFAQCSAILRGHYPVGMTEITQQVSGPGFFPGTSGLYHANTLTTSVKRPYLVLGQDFGTQDYMKTLQDDPKADIESGTALILKGILQQTGISEEDCFFTNALMGVRTGDEIMGKCEGWKDAHFVQKCREAFEAQLEAVQPKAIICLGGAAPGLLSLIFKATQVWNNDTFPEIDSKGKALLAIQGHSTVITAAILVHPSMRNSNVRYRKYASHSGNDAEVALLKDLAARIAAA